MQFAYPHNVWWSIAVAGVIWFACLALVRRRRALRRLYPCRAARPPMRPLTSTLLRSLAVLLLGVALLGPCLGEDSMTIPPARGRDLYLLLDVSRSMLAQDVAPNRLERAKAGLGELAGELERQGGCRVGLIAFAERAALLCPLTTDFRHFEEELKNASLQSVRLRETGYATVDGTQLGFALERLLALVPAKADAAERGLDVLLVSDGGDESSSELAAVLPRLAERGVAVHTLGIGDPTRGTTIPVRLADGRPDLVRFQGQPVQTRLLEAPLQQIAEQTFGRYLPAATGPFPLHELLTELGKKTARELPMAGQVTAPRHRFQWFLAPAIVLFLIENVLSVRARHAPARHRPQSVWLTRLVPQARMPVSSNHQPVTQA